MAQQRPVVESLVARLRDLQRRVRGNQFTDEEIDLLVDEAEKFIEIIDVEPGN
jgi:hypothetical protein